MGQRRRGKEGGIPFFLLSLLSHSLIPRELTLAPPYIPSDAHYTHNSVNLDLGENLGLLKVTTVDLGTELISTLTTVELKELLDIVLGGLDDLDLADKAVLKGIDTVAGLLDGAANDLGDELEDELLKVTGGGLLLDDLEHLLTDGADLGGLSVGGLLDLVGPTTSEGNNEEANDVAISGLDISKGLDEGLPLLDKGPELIGGEVHAVEVGEAVAALDLINAKLDLAEREILGLVEVTKGDFNNTTLEGVVGVPHTLGTVDEGLADVTDLEKGGSLDVIPVLTGEGIDAMKERIEGKSTGQKEKTRVGEEEEEEARGA